MLGSEPNFQDGVYPKKQVIHITRSEKIDLILLPKEEQELNRIKNQLKPKQEAKRERVPKDIKLFFKFTAARKD